MLIPDVEYDCMLICPSKPVSASAISQRSAVDDTGNRAMHHFAIVPHKYPTKNIMVCRVLHPRLSVADGLRSDVSVQVGGPDTVDKATAERQVSHSIDSRICTRW